MRVLRYNQRNRKTSKMSSDVLYSQCRPAVSEIEDRWQISIFNPAQTNDATSLRFPRDNVAARFCNFILDISMVLPVSIVFYQRLPLCSTTCKCKTSILACTLRRCYTTGRIQNERRQVHRSSAPCLASFFRRPKRKKRGIVSVQWRYVVNVVYIVET